MAWLSQGLEQPWHHGRHNTSNPAVPEGSGVFFGGDPLRTRFGTGRRLFVAFLLLVSTFALASSLTLAHVQTIHEGLLQTKHYEDGVRVALELSSAVRDQYAHQAHTIIMGNDSHLMLYAGARRHLLDTIEQVRQYAVSPEERAWVDDIASASDKLDRAFRERIVPAVLKHDAPDVREEHARAQKLVSLIQDRSDRLVDRLESSISQFRADVSNMQVSAMRWTVFFMAGAPLLAILVGLYVHRSVAQPVARLQAGAAQIAEGDLDTRIAIDTADEFGALARQFNSMTQALKEGQRQLVEHERLEREVVLAAEVQASILPHQTPDLPGYEFAGVALAARYVSGDMYDWISFGPEHCYLALADIAGKGVPAAMMTSTARALLRDRAARKSPPGLALSSLNRFLYDDLTQAGSFITVVAANVNRRTATVDYASAGHTEVLWYRASPKACERLQATGPPIGVTLDEDIDERHISLCPGDVLLFYSDGVTEAENEKNEFFGTDRLVALLQANHLLPAAALGRSIVEAVDTFSSGPRSDDLTLIVVKALPRTVPFSGRGDLGHMEEVMELFRALARAYGADFAYELELALSEILTNVIEHAYHDSGGELRGQVCLEADRVVVDLYDDGVPFELSAVPEGPGQPSERGHGLHIARTYLDEVAYSPATGSGNHWRLVKQRRRPASTADGP
jgi:serine phosphatase RsbU (regulator of sigma subunit)/anti-sigma regulatory factor (Ser/Thr protein kinase)